MVSQLPPPRTVTDNTTTASPTFDVCTDTKPGGSGLLPPPASDGFPECVERDLGRGCGNRGVRTAGEQRPWWYD